MVFILKMDIPGNREDYRHTMFNKYWIDQLLKKEFISASECKDIFWMSSSDLNIQIHKMMELNKAGNSAFGTDYVRSSDVAYLLMKLNYLGFDIETGRLFDGMVKQIKKRRFVTLEEVHIVFHSSKAPKICFTWKGGGQVDGIVYSERKGKFSYLFNNIKGDLLELVLPKKVSKQTLTGYLLSLGWLGNGEGFSKYELRKDDIKTFGGHLGDTIL